MVRRVEGLRWARPLAGWPSGIPHSRPRGAKALGLRYERALARALPSAQHGRWWEYEDANGHGLCQTDLIIDLGARVLVLESKLRWVAEGHAQVELLYRPVLERALAKPVFGGVVCKTLVPEARSAGVQVVGDLRSFAEVAEAGGRAVLHWPGTGYPLGPVLGV